MALPWVTVLGQLKQLSFFMHADENSLQDVERRRMLKTGFYVLDLISGNSTCSREIETL